MSSIGANFVSSIRTTVAKITKQDSQELSNLLREEDEFAKLYSSLNTKHKSVLENHCFWGNTREEDLRVVTNQLVQINAKLLAVQSEYIAALKVSKEKMGCILAREKEICSLKSSLKTSAKKRDDASKKGAPTHVLVQETQKIHDLLLEKEAAHVGFTRSDFRDALQIKYKAMIRQAAHMSIIGKYCLKIVDRIPQGVLKVGELPAQYSDHAALERICGEFEKELGRGEIVTFVETGSVPEIKTVGPSEKSRFIPTPVLIEEQFEKVAIDDDHSGPLPPPRPVIYSDQSQRQGSSNQVFSQQSQISPANTNSILNPQKSGNYNDNVPQPISKDYDSINHKSSTSSLNHVPVNFDYSHTAQDNLHYQPQSIQNSTLTPQARDNATGFGETEEVPSYWSTIRPKPSTQNLQTYPRPPQ